jgi:hypothetical protein
MLLHVSAYNHFAPAGAILYLGIRVYKHPAPPEQKHFEDFAATYISQLARPALLVCCK